MAPARPATAALGSIGEELLFSCVAAEATGPFFPCAAACRSRGRCVAAFWR